MGIRVHHGGDVAASGVFAGYLISFLKVVGVPVFPELKPRPPVCFDRYLNTKPPRLNPKHFDSTVSGGYLGIFRRQRGARLLKHLRRGRRMKVAVAV